MAPLRGSALKSLLEGERRLSTSTRIGGRAGTTKRFTIGPYDPRTLTVTAARRRAEQLAAEVQAAKSGDEKDPVEKRRHQREAEKRAKEAAKSRTFRDAAEVFITSRNAKGLSHRYIAETTRLLERETYDVWGSRDLAEITHEEIQALLDEISARPAPFVAKNLYSALRPLFARATKKHPPT